MSKLSLAASAAIAAFPAFVRAQQDVSAELQAIKDRLEAIEEQQAETNERVEGRPAVKAFSAEQLDFGGQVSSLFSYIDGERGRETGHVVSLVELFVKAHINDQFSVFATPGFYIFNGALLDNPASPQVNGDPVYTADNSTVENLFVSRIYGEWVSSDALRLQGGVVGSPHGVTNREYFIPSRAIAQANLHTRVFLDNQLYPQYLEGLKATGKLLAGDTDWFEYDAYVGFQPDNPAEEVGGVRIGYAFRELGLTVAANGGVGNRGAVASPATNFGVLQSPFASEVNGARDYRFGGLDVDLRLEHLTFRGEAYYSGEEGFLDQRALSAETTWYPSAEWGLSYRFDYYDAGSDFNVFAAGVQPRGISTEHVLGCCYNPHPSVRLRLDLHHNNLPNTPGDVQYVNLSWSLSF